MAIIVNIKMGIRKYVSVLPFLASISLCLPFTESIRVDCIRGGVDQMKTVKNGDEGNITSAGYPRGYTVHLPRGDNCQVFLTACRKCQFRFRLSEVRFPPCPHDPKTTIIHDDSPCIQGCDYLILEDANRPFSDYNRRYYFSHNHGATLTSLSREVRLVHCMSNRTSPQGKAFRVQFQVVEKWTINRGSPKDKYRSSGVLMSPNFPNGYAMADDIYTFYVENSYPQGGIRLVFDDWDIASKSTVLVYDGSVDNKTLTVLERFTRPIYKSKTNKVYIKFHTGSNLYSCCKHLGFKATFHFTEDIDWPNEPSTDCSSTRAMSGGGVVRFRGSSINVANHFDCVWIVKRFEEDSHPDGALLQLRAVHPGKGMRDYGGTRLEVHAGITSVSPLLASYTEKNITQEVSWFTTGQGFYARLTGTFYASDKVFFIFTAIYNATNGVCPEHYFLCHNDLCIDEELVCDSVDHCGDHSDESPAQPCAVSTNSPDSPLCDGFRCHDGTGCLSVMQKCDGIPDCYDDSDENGCRDPSSSETNTRAWSLYAYIFLLTLKTAFF